MEKCKECGRKFRSRQALGGHMSTAHAKQDSSNASQAAAPAENEVETTPVAGEPEEVSRNVEQASEPSKADNIRKLLRQGNSPQKIKDVFGYAPSTVDQVAAEFVEPDRVPNGDRKGDGLPVMRKVGQGVEVITPEAVLRRYMDGEDDQKELRGMMKLRAAMLMVMDLLNMRKADAEAFALEVKPILDLMKETREEQDAAAQRARSSSLEAAREAAHEVLGQAMPYLDQRLKVVEEAARERVKSPHPFPQMMGAMDGIMAAVTGQVLKSFGLGPGGQQVGSPGTGIPGWHYVDETAKGGEHGQP